MLRHRTCPYGVIDFTLTVSSRARETVPQRGIVSRRGTCTLSCCSARSGTSCLGFLLTP